MSALAVTTPTISTTKPPVPFKKPDLKLNHLVYEKYCDMLKTYNGKANDLIETLPAANIFKLKQKL